MIANDMNLPPNDGVLAKEHLALNAIPPYLEGYHATN